MAATMSPHLSRCTLTILSNGRPHLKSHRSALRLLTPNIPHRTIRGDSGSASPPSSSNSSTKQKPGGPIILEAPDKFRPPSHPSRLNSRRTTGSHYASYNGSAGYNQRATEQEREAQKTKSYPHMFPNPGTLMYKFLTNRAIHLWITLGTLSILALTTLIQSFVRTSPFAHLLPPISDLFYRPLSYTREVLSVYRLSIDYETEQTWQSRQAKIADAQKRRLYRRAHGMEDLDAAEDQGIDVRGLVEWDDGLTNREREKGERRVFEMSRRGMEVLTGVKREKQEEEGVVDGMVDQLDDVVLGNDGREMLALDGVGSVEEALGQQEQQMQQQQQPQRKKVKRWLGIWE